MEAQYLSTIEALVESIKLTTVARDVDMHSLVAPSAYDTAWLAMIPNTCESHKPMFGLCLNWVLKNQNELGFWGDCDGRGEPTLESLASTLACVVALRRWNVGSQLVNKGLNYINSPEVDKLLRKEARNYPLWFAIVFPGMVDIALESAHLTIGLELSDVFFCRQQILETQGFGNKHGHSLLMSYLEALPSSYSINGDVINSYVNDDDGSLFQSPSATARAFMATGNSKCLHYLQSLVRKFSNNGVPSAYPVDEELVKLCTVNHVERLGLSEYFVFERQRVLEEAYKNYTIIMNHRESPNSVALLRQRLLRDSLSFRLLRMHGYKVLPQNLCWFLYDEETKDKIESNCEYFSCAMLNVYRATDLMFSSEFELQEAREYSRKLLEKSILIGRARVPLIEHELSLPWMARLDHLEHRLWIEESEANALWTGKISSQRFSTLHNDKLHDLAMQNYQFKQFIFQNELEELKRWSKEYGLVDVGFGREKTAYCYFGVAASIPSLPYDSEIRMLAAKSGILITVADDFFDMEGSDLNELRTLTDAIGRWNGKFLCGKSKIIFDALDDLVTEMAIKYSILEGDEIMSYLRGIWYETFCSWLKECEWGRNESRPSMEEYLRVAMISIAIHTIVLPVSCFLKPSLPLHKLQPSQYERITKLIMIISRLLNDLQSYEKEKHSGDVNSVLLYLESNPGEGVEEASASVRDILKKKTKELLECVLIDDSSNDLPREVRLLHLSCLRVFQMFFNSSNRYDSETDVLDDITKAVYLPPVRFRDLTAKLVPSLPPVTTIREYKRPRISLMISSSFSVNKILKPSARSFGSWRISNGNTRFVNFRPAWA